MDDVNRCRPNERSPPLLQAVNFSFFFWQFFILYEMRQSVNVAVVAAWCLSIFYPCHLTTRKQRIWQQQEKTNNIPYYRWLGAASSSNKFFWLTIILQLKSRTSQNISRAWFCMCTRHFTFYYIALLNYFPLWFLVWIFFGGGSHRVTDRYSTCM